MTRASSKHRRLPEAVAESPNLARTTAQATRFRGPGEGLSDRITVCRERLPVIG